MYRLLIDVVVLGSMALAPEVQENTPSASLSFQQWDAVLFPEDIRKDVVQLKNGRKLYGELKSIPSLYYSFGQVPFDLSSVRGVEVWSAGGKAKARYRDDQGLNYAGTLKDRHFLFVEQSSSLTEPASLRKLPVHEVSEIFLYNRKEPESQEDALSGRLYRLEWKNGDQLVFISCTPSLALQTRGKNKALPFDRIVKVRIDGGLYGDIREKGVDKDLELSLLTHRYLTIYVPKLNQTLRIPWNDLAEIEVLEKPLPASEAAEPTPSISSPSEEKQSVSSPSAEADARIKIWEDLALAPEAFEAFLQPISYPKERVDATGHDGGPMAPSEENEEEERQRSRKRVPPEAIWGFVEEFDSPIMALYDIESGAASIEAQAVDSLQEREEVAFAEEDGGASHTNLSSIEPEEGRRSEKKYVLEDIYEAFLLETLGDSHTEPEAFYFD